MNKEERKKQVLQMFYAWGYRYLARNKNGWMSIFVERPTKKGDYWLARKEFTNCMMFDELFEDVTFDDVEPLCIAHELGAGDGNDA